MITLGAILWGFAALLSALSFWDALGHQQYLEAAFFLGLCIVAAIFSLSPWVVKLEWDNHHGD